MKAKTHKRESQVHLSDVPVVIDSSGPRTLKFQRTSLFSITRGVSITTSLFYPSKEGRYFELKTIMKSYSSLFEYRRTKRSKGVNAGIKSPLFLW